MIKVWRLGVCILALTAVFVWKQKPETRLKVIFCDVGQGDASIVMKGRFTFLIDTGPAGGRVIGCLGKHLPFWDKRIEVLAVSHPQSDHMGDLVEIIKRYQIDLLLMTDEEADSEKTKEVLLLTERKKIATRIVRQGDTLRYEDLLFDILWPKESKEIPITDENSRAMVLLLKQYGFSVLFTSDIGATEELAIGDSGVLKKVNILKVAHHGSKFSSTEAFLQLIKPDWAIFSVGAKNTYGHPAKEVVSRFEALGSGIWRTDQQHEIGFGSDGRKFWVLK